MSKRTKKVKQEVRSANTIIRCMKLSIKNFSFSLESMISLKKKKNDNSIKALIISLKTTR
jgi:hypothetical protein